MVFLIISIGIDNHFRYLLMPSQDFSNRKLPVENKPTDSNSFHTEREL